MTTLRRHIIHFVIAGVLPIAGSTSCTDDEPTEGAAPETIAFFDPEQRTPVTTQTISEFKVWAELKDWTAIMKGVTVKRTGPNSWSYSPAVQWPDEAVSFYAVSPASADMRDVYMSFSIFYNCDGVTDLLVAVRKDVRQADGRIKLNFCHTLARITTEISTPLTDTIVEVRGISLADVGGAGSFQVPDRTTVLNEPPADISDRWQIWNMSATNFDVFDGGDGCITLSAAPWRPVNGAEFMLPVRLNPLQFNGYINGSAIRVVYRLIDRKSGEVLWPTALTPAHHKPHNLPDWGLANLALQPVTPEGRWYAGREYHYNISILGEPAFPADSRSAKRQAGAQGCLIGCRESVY